MPTNFNTVELFIDGLEVGEARSNAAADCLRRTPRPEFLFFIDYDVLLPPDSLLKLFYRARTIPDHDVYCGVYCCKGHHPPEPLIYGEHGQGTVWDWAVGDLLTTESHGVKSVHMGLTLIRVSAFQKIVDAGLVGGDGTDQDDRPFFKTHQEEQRPGPDGSQTRAGTEDIYFCDLLMKAGGSILVDTSVLAGHEDKRTGRVYGLPIDATGPVGRAKWTTIDGKRNQDDEDVKCRCAVLGFCNLTKSRDEYVERFVPSGGMNVQIYALKDCPDCHGTGVVPVKLAIDLGAGSTRRRWDGYRTYTLDARRESGADFVQDLRWLNLPDDHYDLVASSHAFEHVGRWDQERVWAEAFRVCKPGGRVEVIVPNVEWAAKKIAAGELDAHVMNVLYGAQEQHGYAREMNTHYFGYTPAVGRALAENAGFQDVTTECYDDNPDLGYNLILRGRKPSPADAPPSEPTAEFSATPLTEPTCAG